MSQDVSTFLNDLLPFVPYITVAVLFLSAVLAVLHRRERHGLPENIVAQVNSPASPFMRPNKDGKSDWQAIRPASKAGNSDWVARRVEFYLPAKPPRSKWLIDEIRIAKSRYNWLTVPGEGMLIRDKLSEYPKESIVYSPGGDWTNRIRYDTPVESGNFLLHPDAPKKLTFLFRVCLRYRPRVKRWVDVIPDDPRHYERLRFGG